MYWEEKGVLCVFSFLLEGKCSVCWMEVSLGGLFVILACLALEIWPDGLVLLICLCYVYSELVTWA